MIQMRTILEVADNSGARKISCILPLGGSTGRYAGLGDIITANVKESAPDAPEPVRKGKVAVLNLYGRMRLAAQLPNGLDYLGHATAIGRMVVTKAATVRIKR